MQNFHGDFPRSRGREGHIPRPQLRKQGEEMDWWRRGGRPRKRADPGRELGEKREWKRVREKLRDVETRDQEDPRMMCVCVSDR